MLCGQLNRAKHAASVYSVHDCITNLGFDMQSLQTFTYSNCRLHAVTADYYMQ